MKKSVFNSTILSAILISFLLTQGCSVYKNRVTPEQAIEKGPVKVFYKHGWTAKFKRLVKKDSMIYGVYNSDFTRKMMPVKKDNVRFVRVKARVASAILTGIGIAAGVTIVAIPVLVVHAIAREDISWTTPMMTCFQPGNGSPAPVNP